MTQFTSKAIEKSFIGLLNERPLDKITIRDITALLEHILNADVDSWEEGLHIVIPAITLPIPSLIGRIMTQINYDMLSYLPGDIDTVVAQDIPMDDILHRFR